jgi:putative flavoprotein involved in K+ transport
MDHPIFDVIVAGAGHAGLSASYYLKKLGLTHLVLERGRTGEPWRSQRWDGFKFNTANQFNELPGFSYYKNDPGGFGTPQDYVNMLETYIATFQLPVVENATILSVEKEKSSQHFQITVSENNRIKKYYCRQVIIASGTQNEKKIPAFSELINAGIKQLHTCEYRNAAQLPEGAVLVVGGAQSGCQVAEELADAGKKVYLSTSMVARIPRRYRGKDIMEWLMEMNFFDVKTEEITDPQMLYITAPQLTGADEGKRTISLQALAKKSITILGKMKNASEQDVWFKPDAALNVQFADLFSKNVKDMIDGFIQHHQLTAPEPETDAADAADVNSSCVSSITSLNLKEYYINTIIWATGFSSNLDYIQMPVLDADKKPIHQNGISPVEGLYFLGLPWLRKRKSSILFGMAEDAAFISEKVYALSKKRDLKRPALSES